jgi:hypothetical protein
MNDRDLSADYPVRRMTREAFEALVIEIRNGAGDTMTDLAVGAASRGESNDATMEDVRLVWHAAEIALAVVRSDYLPKREAMFDVFALVKRYPLTEAELEREWRESSGRDDEDEA